MRLRGFAEKVVFRDRLVETGLFHRNYSILPAGYRQTFCHSSNYDLVLSVKNNTAIVYEVGNGWYIIREKAPELHCETGWECYEPGVDGYLYSLPFEEILEIVEPILRLKLLFHLDLLT